MDSWRSTPTSEASMLHEVVVVFIEFEKGAGSLISLFLIGFFSSSQSLQRRWLHSGHSGLLVVDIPAP